MNTLAAPPALELAQVSKSLGGSALFAGLSLRVMPGQSLAIVGESGAGKSTLLHIMAGLESADKGQVFWAGQMVSGLHGDEAARLRLTHVGLVFQAYYLMPHLNALQNIELPFLLAGQAPDTARCLGLLEAVGLANKATRFPRELSGGEQQRIAIARAMALAPPLILADEPTGNLDVHTADKVLALLASVCTGQGSALVMVTHSPSAAQMMGQQLRLHDQALQPTP